MIHQPEQAGGKQTSVLRVAILKVTEVVEEENSILKCLTVMPHAGFTDRKNQALRELMAAQRFEGANQSTEASRPCLEDLSAKLKENAALLKLHIGAIGEVSDIIIGSLREAESDGTYSRGNMARRVSNAC